MVKFWPSTWRWALSIARLTMRCSMGTPSPMPILAIRPEMRSLPKMRIKSSSRHR